MYCKEKWRTAGGKDPLLGRVDGFQIDPNVVYYIFHFSSTENRDTLKIKIQAPFLFQKQINFPPLLHPGWETGMIETKDNKERLHEKDPV